MKFEFHIEKSIAGGEYRLWIIATSKNGKAAVGRLTLEEIVPGMETMPTLTLPFSEQSSLLQLTRELENIGFLKEETQGELSATKRHLQDMRVLAKLAKPEHQQ